MKAIELWDTSGYVFLSLREVLAPIAEDCLTSLWQVTSYIDPDGEKYFWLGGDGEDAFDAVVDTGKKMTGPEFMTLAERTSQVIWGVFKGYDPDEDHPWIVLQAIDSTLWRCETKDLQTRQSLMRTFKDVRLKP